MGNMLSSIFGRGSRAQSTSVTTPSPESIPRDLAECLSSRFSNVWQPKFRSWLQQKDLRRKKQGNEHLLDFVLLLYRLKSVRSCEVRTTKIVEGKQSIRSPSQENISQNQQRTSAEGNLSVNKVEETKSRESCSEVENVQNERTQICEEILGNYIQEGTPTFKYKIPLSKPDLGSRLARTLKSNIQNENFAGVIDETLEDNLVGIRLSKLYDEFHKESVLKTHTPMAKGVGVLMSIL